MNKRTITSFKDGVRLEIPEWVIAERPRHARAIVSHLLEWKIERKNGIVKVFSDDREFWDYFTEDDEDWDSADDTMYVIARLDEEGYIDARERVILYKDDDGTGMVAKPSGAKATTYYLIRERIVGKRENDGKTCRDYLFKDGNWVADNGSVIMDRLIGYDPFEPEDSPYWCGNMDVMDEIEEIPAAKALTIMGDQVKALLSEKWKRDFAEEKRVWDEKPRWPAKHVRTEFRLYGRSLVIKPEDIGLTNNGWDQGFMETIQNKIERDLACFNATDICSFGFLA